MKSRKSKKRSDRSSSHQKCSMPSDKRAVAITFNLTKANISCFIGENKPSKKGARKPSKSLKNRKPSLNKN